MITEDQVLVHQKDIPEAVPHHHLRNIRNLEQAERAAAIQVTKGKAAQAVQEVIRNLNPADHAATLTQDPALQAEAIQSLDRVIDRVTVYQGVLRVQDHTANQDQAEAVRGQQVQDPAAVDQEKENN